VRWTHNYLIDNSGPIVDLNELQMNPECLVFLLRFDITATMQTPEMLVATTAPHPYCSGNPQSAGTGIRS
jgi:hypothetical protein